MLKLENISKKYGKHWVLDQVNLEFTDESGISGLLGRNGVGKTTLMKIINNMIAKHQGQVTFEGVQLSMSDQHLRQMVYVGGIIPNSNSHFMGKISQLLKWYTLAYEHFDLEFANKMLDHFKINRKHKFKNLSTGNKTLVQNIIGLASRAPITIMDEPTNGLDSVNRNIFFRYMMEDYSEHPRMFILSTHLIMEIENYLTHVIMLKDQQVLIADSLENVQSKAFRLIQAQVPNKKVLRTEKLGSLTSYLIYDTLSLHEQEAVRSAGGKVERIDLQTLFNGLMEGE